MPYDLSNYLVIGVSSRALFDLNLENGIFEKEGLEAYCRYQLEHENDVLRPGAGFALIEAILKINDIESGVRRAEVVIVSRNSADTSLRISNSIDHYKLDITRAAFTGGEPVAKYLNAFDVDLFLSATEEDVQAAVASNVAAGLIYDGPVREATDPLQQIRIAFDGDAVLFSKESEDIYQQQGLEAFIAHEKLNAQKPLPEGPFAKLLKTLSYLQFDLTRDDARRLFTEAALEIEHFETAEYLARFPSVRAFVDGVAAGAPATRHAIAQLSESDRHGFLGDVEHSLSPYETGDGVELPTSAHLIVAFNRVYLDA